ncbi:hypothetical protein GP486_005221 [Trichoglossum hirsutum]|uniref:C2H2-type domain-containing protein n=1 Tax=Trichoglossum hirsutum TaxID=265104 RepID=A0A9P8L9N2_9PEZI|nr:hypothetical protein GP486_005221 [Trichoglossum hirsutum]
MEAPYATQIMGQSPFFYYNPDPKPDHRQHGHFSPHPNGSSTNNQFHHFQHQTQGTDQSMPLPSSVIYSRPSSASSQSQFKNQAAVQSAMTPMASPQPVCQKPTLLVQDNTPSLLPLNTACASDMYFFPSTPPLSTSGSSINSPPSSCGVLPTPINGNGNMFGLEIFEGVKEGCEAEVQSENLTGDWSRGSPPMTPVFINPSAVRSQSCSTTSPSDLLSATACPSLSPSPSPLPQSSTSDTEFDFCDPRNLTVGSSDFAVTTTLSTEFPPLPTLCPGDDDEHRIMLGNESLTLNADISIKSAFDFTGPTMIMHGLDEFSELDRDSEDEFVTGLVNLPTENATYLGAKRQRTDLLGLEDDSFLSEDESEDFDEEEPLATPALPTPASTNRRCSQGPAKKQKKQSRKIKAKRPDDDEDGFEFEDMISASRFEMTFLAAARGETGSTTQNTGKQTQSSAPQTQPDNNQSGSSSDAQAPPPAPVVRRGRKQSLTEDPSKTFVCDLCSRRFRRQEHLKRHYRSLHTQEKPFECNECGKKFSRSDNLSQHARTHGSGAIVMGVLEDGEVPKIEHDDSVDESDTGVLGAVLFEAAQAAAANASSSSSASSVRDSISPGPSENKNSRRKRKRED